jgi:hypothetical protein
MPDQERRREATTLRADGVVWPIELFFHPHHPVRSSKEASRFFSDVAATPPRLRRGVSLPELYAAIRVCLRAGFFSSSAINPSATPGPQLPKIRESLTAPVGRLTMDIGI